jgi:hypothetical protein
MSQDRHTIPDWELELFRLGELTASRAELIRAHLEADPALAARLEDLPRQREALMERLPPRVVAAHAHEPPATTPAGRRPWWVAVPVLAALLALAVLLPDGGEPPTPGQAPVLREKGGEPYLRIYRQVPGGLEELDPGDPAASGARLQISYAALGSPYGAVLSLDGRGAVTVHLPLEGQRSAELVPEGTVDLATSYVLDDAPSFERFVLLSSAQPFPLDPILAAARSLAADPQRAQGDALRLPRGIRQSDFVLRKEPVGP